MDKPLINKPEEDKNLDSLLRPESFDRYVGQGGVKRSLRIMIDAAKGRNEVTDHLLFYGQAGLGKTTLAHIVAKEMGGDLKVTAGPAIERAGDLASVLTNLESGDILFIDEIHRLNHMVEEVLYPAMESRKLNIMIGKGPSARTISLDLPPFTIIGATTRVNLLSNPLRSRFGASFRLDYYDVADIAEIVARSAGVMNVGIEPEAVSAIAGASRFTPRIANRLLKRARDFSEVTGEKSITPEAVREAFSIMELDHMGLEYQDRRLLEIIITRFNGGPAGINALSAVMGEEYGVIEEVYEPYLLKIDFIRRTPAGRTATDSARKHLGLD